jgi:hypothetical protein
MSGGNRHPPSYRHVIAPWSSDPFDNVVPCCYLFDDEWGKQHSQSRFIDNDDSVIGIIASVGP